MQVTVDLIDWEWIKAAPNIQFFLEVMLDQDDADLRFGTGCYDFAGGWGDSALLYLEVCDAFLLVLKKISKTEQGKLLEQGLLPLLSPESKIDELGLQAFPEEGYMSSLSPQTITTMVKACNGLALPQLALEFEEYISQKRFQRNEYLKILERYLEQWVIALRTALKEKKGILVHIG